MHSPTGIVFDLDGTLIDSRGDIAAAVNHALVASGRAALPAAEIVRLVGDGAHALLAQLSGAAEDSKEVHALFDDYIAYYVAHPIAFSRWMPGAKQALDEVVAQTSLPLAICTNKARPVTEAILAGLGETSRFRVVSAAEPGSPRKPSGEPLLAIARELQTAANKLIMVGDGTQDILAARQAGCRSVGLLSGFQGRDRLLAVNPDVVIESMSELPAIIQRWCDATARLSAVR